MKFEYSEGVRFTCQQCGDCCRGWNVPLASGERQRLEALEWRGLNDALVGLSPAVRVKGQVHVVERLARRDDDSCIYLGAHDECLLHAHFGAESKPLACSMYPFSFRCLGDRVMVDAAFSCRAVNHGIGEPLGESASAWANLQPALSSLSDRGRHRLTRRYRVGGELLWEIEQQLLQYLAQPSMRLLDRVRCALEYLRLATTGDPTTPSAATLRDVMSKAIPEQIMNRARPASELDKTQRAVFLLWTYLVLNPAPIDIQEWHRRKQKRESERRAAIADRFRKTLGQPWVDNRELGITFEQVESVGVRFFERAADPIVETFLRAKIIGQRFLFAAEEELPLVDAVQRLFLCYPIAIWAAKALAAARGASETEETDLRASLRLIDRSFDQIRTSALAAKQRKAWEFIVGETDLAIATSQALLGE